MSPPLLAYALLALACFYGLVLSLSEVERPQPAGGAPAPTGLRAALAGLGDVL